MATGYHKKRTTASHWEGRDPAGVYAWLSEPSTLHYSLADMSRARRDTPCALNLRGARTSLSSLEAQDTEVLALVLS